MTDLVPVSGLRRLWRQAFGDTEEFLDLFFARAFSPERCLWSEDEGRITAALYWLDCEYRGGKIAYVYAVATDEALRGRGLCRSLMEKLHNVLTSRGYAGSILVPGEPGLVKLYEKLGYRLCGGIREIRCKAAEGSTALTPIGPAEYARLRRSLLPEGGVIQEGENLAFLEKLGRFYAGDGFCLWAAPGCGTVTGELLGDTEKAPAITAALGAKGCIFHTPGNDRNFAMYRPITDAPAPTYLGFAFD